MNVPEQLSEQRDQRGQRGGIIPIFSYATHARCAPALFVFFPSFPFIESFSKERPKSIQINLSESCGIIVEIVLLVVGHLY